MLERFRDGVGVHPAPGDVADALLQLTGQGGGRSVSAFLATRGTVQHMREFAVHRSAYQLKEADPHTWAIPRLSGGVKAAMVEIQADEYGAGTERDMHQNLFALTMHELGLDSGYGAYLDLLPATTLGPRQHHLLLRVAPALARGAGRPPGAVRDDVGRTDGSLQPSAASDGLRPGRPTLLRSARRCGRASRAGRRPRPRRRPRGARPETERRHPVRSAVRRPGRARLRRVAARRLAAPRKLIAPSAGGHGRATRVGVSAPALNTPVGSCAAAPAMTRRVSVAQPHRLRFALPRGIASCGFGVARKGSAHPSL